MPLTVIATPGAANANSYLTKAEAQAYFDARLPVAGWDNADSQDALIVMATRTLDAMFAASRVFVPGTDCNCGYFRIRPAWTGAPTSSTQALAWPRTGMYDRNGNAIPSNVIPQALKDATAELAGALGTKDTLVDNDNAVQGITSVKAGSVAIAFAQGAVISKPIPDSVLFLLVPSWLSDEKIEPMYSSVFEIMS